MKILLVYDSVSVNKNTEKVAEAIRDILKAKGFEVQSTRVEDADASNVKDYDCFIVGSPTQAWKAVQSIRDFLNSLHDGGFAGKNAVAFDTRIKSRLSGSAVDGMEKRLKQLGFKIIMPGLAAYVEGKQSNPILIEGELDKTRKFAEDLANALRK